MVMGAAALGGAFRRFIENPGAGFTGLVSPEQALELLEKLPQAPESIRGPLEAIGRVGAAFSPITDVTIPKGQEQQAQLLSEMTSPYGIALNVATAGKGPAVAKALTQTAKRVPGFYSIPFRVGAKITEPLTVTRPGFAGFAQRAGQEQGLEFAALRAMQGVEPNIQDLPTPVRVPAQLGAALFGAATAAKPLSNIGGTKLKFTEPDFGKADISKPDANIQEVADLGNEGLFTSKGVFGDDNQYRKVIDDYEDKLPEPKRKVKSVIIDPITKMSDKLEIIFDRNNARKLGEKIADKAVLGRVLKFFDPSVKAKNLSDKLSIGYASLVDEARGRVRNIFAPLKEYGDEDILFESPAGIDQYGRFVEGRFQGRTMNEIVENLKDPLVQKLLNQKQLEYLQKLNNLDRSISRMANKFGGKIKLFDESENLYATRVTSPINPDTGKPVKPEYLEMIFTGKALADDSEIALKKAMRLPDDPIFKELTQGQKKQRLVDIGTEFSASRERKFKTAKAAVDQGYAVLPYSMAVKLKLEQFYRLNAAFELEDYIRQIVGKKGKFKVGGVEYDVEEVFGKGTKVKRKSRKRTFDRQSELFRKGFLKGGAQSKVFLNSLLGGIAGTQERSIFFSENNLGKGLNGLNSVQRSGELAFDGSLFGIQFLHVLSVDLIENLFKAKELKNLLSQSPTQTIRKTFPLFAGDSITYKTIKNFADGFSNGMLDLNRARAGNARNIAGAVDELRESKTLELYGVGDELEFLEGAFVGGRLSKIFKDAGLKMQTLGYLSNIYSKASLPFQQAWVYAINTAKIELYKSFRFEFLDQKGFTQAFGSPSGLDDFGRLLEGPFRGRTVIEIADNPNLVAQLTDAQRQFTTKALKIQRDVEDYINNVTGTVNSSRLGISPKQKLWENVALLAPRYGRAIGGLLISAGQGGFRGKKSRKAILSMIAAMALLSSAYTIGQVGIERGGYDARSRSILLKRLRDTLNPTKGSFFMVRIGNTMLGPGGRVISYIKHSLGIGNAAVQGAKNAALYANAKSQGDEEQANVYAANASDQTKRLVTQLKRFALGQGSATVSLGTSFASGESFMGDPIWSPFGGWEQFDDFGTLSLNTALELGTTGIPIWVQSSVIDPARKKGLSEGSIGEPEDLLSASAEFVGARAYPQPLGSTKDTVAQQSSFQVNSWDDLDAFEKFVLENEPEFEEYLLEQDLELEALGNKYAEYRLKRRESEALLMEDMYVHLETFLRRIVNSRQSEVYGILRDLSQGISASKADKYSRLDEWKKENGIEKYTGEPTDKEFDNILNEWYALYEDDTIVKKRESDGGVVAGSIDFEKLIKEQNKIMNKISFKNKSKLTAWLDRKEGIQGLDQILGLLGPVGTKPDGEPQFRNRQELQAAIQDILFFNPVLNQETYSPQQILRLRVLQ